MGYETYFSGELTITPTLTPAQRQEIVDFTEIRHEGEHEVGIGIWCDWRISEVGNLLEAESGKNYEYIQWLQYLIERFFEPWGRRLNGSIHWDGEESGDVGYIDVENNTVTTRVLEDLYVPSGYRWSPPRQTVTARSTFGGA